MSEAAPMAGVVKQDAGRLKIAGTIMVVMGFLAMMAPFYTGIAVAIMVGAMMLVSGVVQFFAAFKAGSWGRGILKLLLGALTAIVGLMLLGHPLYALASLTLILAAYFFVEGIFEIVFAFQLDEGKGWMIFSGILSLLLGVMIWNDWPVSGGWAIGILVGIKLLFGGMTMIAVGSAAKRAAGAVEQTAG
jgi:uncharacterized membrane protein HdeD (DUF308 family)